MCDKCSAHLFILEHMSRKLHYRRRYEKLVRAEPTTGNNNFSEADAATPLFRDASRALPNVSSQGYVMSFLPPPLSCRIYATSI
ncbi:hypothetical protein PUN28_006213 [Cardiocondyla obscurior]|uniref:C2H2-type domain-containing protein n=1 Tax=Cardiocondyla obscurior TaxID=286306 RepID=A0AAW2G9J9_9HYME